MPSPRSFTILFIVGSTFPFFFISEYLNHSWCFSSSFSTFEDQRIVSLKSCSILFKIHGSSFMPSSHNCFDCENSFHPSGAFHELFSFLSSGAHHFRRIIHSSLQLSFSKSYRCTTYSFISRYSIVPECSRYLEDSCFHSAFVQALSRMLSHSSHLIQPAQSLC